VNRRELGFDAALGVVATMLTLAILASDGLGRADPTSRALDVLGVVLACASCLPLLARRRFPGTVYLMTVASSLALLALSYPLDFPIGAALAAFGLAMTRSGDPRRLPRLSATFAVASFVPAIALVYELRGIAATGIMTELFSLGAVFAGVWMAGDRARLRRERMAHLEERNSRVEREVERERRLAAAEERTRIARELHDAAGHAINVILVQAGAARLLHGRNPDASKRAITTIEDVARDTIGEIDRMVRALRDSDEPASPPTADHLALDALVERHRASGLAVAADVRAPREALSHSVAWATYRILQEALTNAARHGGGSADVAVHAGPDAVEITVTNPTAPAAPDQRNGEQRYGGHGIVGMRERASLLGGTLDTAARDGMFRLHARLPHAEPAP
jgi:signal transduction histidine kinase